jgi:hypothetical protein
MSNDNADRPRSDQSADPRPEGHAAEVSIAPTSARTDGVLRELDSYRAAIREAFDEGFALAKFGGPIERAWEHSEARQTDWAFAHTRISIGVVVRERAQITDVGDAGSPPSEPQA